MSYSRLTNSQEYAGEGLRTLALAYKDLDEDKFEEWKERHHKASTALEDREAKLDAIYEEIEKDLMVKSPLHRVFASPSMQVNGNSLISEYLMQSLFMCAFSSLVLLQLRISFKMVCLRPLSSLPKLTSKSGC